MAGKRHVFIGGLHRSGTTLLAQVLGQHPEVSHFSQTGVIEDEGQFLQTVYQTDNDHGGPGRFAFDRQACLNESSGLVSAENSRKLGQEWGRYWDRSKAVYIEKTPANLIRGRFLQALFPDSYFIFVLRQPVATSIATYKWSGTGIYSLLHHWVTAHEIMRGDLPFLHRALVVSYEGLMAEPAVIMRHIEDFIGLKHHEYRVKFDPDMNAKYFDSWRTLFLSSASRVKPVPPVGAVHAHKKMTLRNSWRRYLKGYIRKKLFGEDRQLSLTLYEAQDAVAMFEESIHKWGYSLLDLKKYENYPGKK